MVQASASVARVGEGAQAAAAEMARQALRDVAEQPVDHAGRQAVSLDSIGVCQCLQGRHGAPLTTDHAPHQALVRQ